MNIYFCPSDLTSDPEDYLECPGGDWCCGPNGTLDPSAFDDRSYVYYGIAAEDEIVWLTGLGWLLYKEYTTPMDPEDYIPMADEDLSNIDFATLETVARAQFPEEIALIEAEYGTLRMRGNGGGDTVYRLREGIERFLITDINNPAQSAQAQSALAIMWDQIEMGQDFTHIPGGCNVLFLDGHVKFYRYPSEHPTSKLNGMLGRLIG